MGEKLPQMIKEGDWNKVHKIISSKKVLATYRNNLIRDRPINLQGLLLLACMYNPPLRVIADWIKRYPSAAYAMDDEKNRPLHIACKYGASPQVVQELLRANGKAAFQKDVNGMLPIHKVCRFYYKNTQFSLSRYKTEEALVQILQSLLEIAPRSLLEEDNFQMCPIEHALESGLCIDIVNGLQSKAKGLRLQNKSIDEEEAKLKSLTIT